MRVGNIRAGNRLQQGIVEANRRTCFCNLVDFRLLIRHDYHLLPIVVFLGRKIPAPPDKPAALEAGLLLS